MKKYSKILVAILLISLLATSLFACINPDSDTEGTMTLVIMGDDATVFTVDLSKIPPSSSSTGLMAILDYLKGEGKLTYTADDSGYGAFLTQVGELQQGDGYYIYVYTDVESDIDVSQNATQVTYNGKSYTNSGVGVSLMSVKDGCTIIISTIYFG